MQLGIEALSGAGLESGRDSGEHQGRIGQLGRPDRPWDILWNGVPGPNLGLAHALVRLAPTQAEILRAFGPEPGALLTSCPTDSMVLLKRGTPPVVPDCSCLNYPGHKRRFAG